ncbi:hypothetical protein SAICODRAFT_51664 [Saitoella complicata NRRL Y-17804]|uniref:CAP-Gly domain-containing protein n=1 Tax=Saitoella complicata (strain BCRC 22490 / CBS 7301 / JCM 7358 / NBRC 10748 / NRRL Y-17804) TaxID=698492 RepID=A0A0E9NLW0_SAICN|nr:uncharacterized protein SAICODRAFT_51664 [Saitoella complicata NRRL Y-17804]ODQ56361.1 hypothetical protein SAICODRAFT_51664 [Saitoella complicata NRRL Y-17804]GAO50839.1 hypothetical protein G7K_4959-t1 [Saitoella complicata NRRL Y-17804]
MADRPSSPTKFLPGARVHYAGGKKGPCDGTVRFNGTASFATGRFIGVELDQPVGLNDGSKDGVTYFTCKEGHGVFVRANALTSLKDEDAKSDAGSAASTERLSSRASPVPPPSRDSSISRRQSSIASQSDSRATSPFKIPALPLPRTGTGPRLSMNTNTALPPISAVRRTSGTTPTTVAGRRLSRTPSQTSDTIPTADKPVSSRTPSATALRPPSTVRRLTPVGPALDDKRDTTPVVRPPSSTGTSAARRLESNVSSTSTASSKDFDDLRAKYVKLAKEKMKLEGQLPSLSEEIASLRKRNSALERTLKTLEDEKITMEARDVDHDEIVEMATLDKEMAEEKCEVLTSELEILKEKLEELQLEVEVLREENGGMGRGTTEEEKGSSGWIQMEKQNERLKEALVRLRDISAETEAELKAQLKSAEKELQQAQQVKPLYNITKERLEQSESIVDELRQQLDAAMGAEEMLEDLTEKNLTMSEQLAQMQSTIEDLEALKELADQLEEDHIETEKQMQQEIDYKDMLVRDQTKRIHAMEETTFDYESTIMRFRDLVGVMQADIDSLRRAREMSDTETDQLNARTRTIEDLNLKLQAVSTGSQAKTIDLELGKLQALEAGEQLAIVQLYLPDSFAEHRDAMDVLMKFKRIAFKANLLHQLLQKRPVQTTLRSEDDVAAFTEVLEHLVSINGLSTQFMAYLDKCDVEQFLSFGAVLFELEPVEKTLDRWILAMRQDEVRERPLSEELRGNVALLSHLSEVRLGSTSNASPERYLSLAGSIEQFVSNVEVIISPVRQFVNERITPSDETHVDGSDTLKKLEKVIGQARNAKVVIGRVSSILNGLKSNGSTPDTNALATLEEVASLCRNALNLCRDVTKQLRIAADDAQEKGIPLTTDAVSPALGGLDQARSVLGEVTSALEQLDVRPSHAQQAAKVDKRAHPWVLHARSLKNEAASATAAEEAITRAEAKLINTVTLLKVKDKDLEEAHLKIELLEARMKDVKKQSDEIATLKTQGEAAALRERELTVIVEDLTKDVERLERDLDLMRKAVEDVGPRRGTVTTVSSAEADKQVKRLHALEEEVKTLQSIVARFRAESHKAMTSDALLTKSWLEEPLMVKPISRDPPEATMIRDARALLCTLREFTSEAKVVDLSTSSVFDGSHGRKWVPVKKTARWQVLKDAEEWSKITVRKENMLKTLRMGSRKKEASDTANRKLLPAVKVAG